MGFWLQSLPQWARNARILPVRAVGIDPMYLYTVYLEKEASDEQPAGRNDPVPAGDWKGGVSSAEVAVRCSDHCGH